MSTRLCVPGLGQNCAAHQLLVKTAQENKAVLLDLLQSGSRDFETIELVLKRYKCYLIAADCVSGQLPSKDYVVTKEY